MGDPLQASNAWSMGNLGLSDALRDVTDVSSYDVEDLGDPAPLVGWWVRLRGRAVSWSLSAGVFLAYVNLWPGGR